MEEQLLNILMKNEAVSFIVGNRIRPIDRPQTDGLPAITFQKIDGTRDYNMGGASGFVVSRVQIDCWGKKYSDSKATARAVAKALSGIKQPFQASFLLDETDSSEETNNVRIFRTRLDFQIYYEEVF